MANVAYLESLLNGLPVEQRRILAQVVRAFDELRFGAPSDSAVAAENMGGHLVPFTTSSVSEQETPVAHNLARVPRWILPALDPGLIGSRLIGDLEITREADMTYLYVKSAETSVRGLLYVE